MPVFFKRLRKQALRSGRWRSGLSYALGELTLIVLGILIALGISNCNQRRQALEAERHFQEALARQTAASAIMLDTLITVAQRTVEASRQLLASPNPFENSHECWRLVVEQAVAYDLDFRPLDATVRELTATGQVRILRDEHIRNSLYGWDSWLAGIHRQEDYLRQLRDRIIGRAVELGADLTTFVYAAAEDCSLSPDIKEALLDEGVRSWLAVYQSSVDALIVNHYDYAASELSKLQRQANQFKADSQ